MPSRSYCQESDRLKEGDSGSAGNCVRLGFLENFGTIYLPTRASEQGKVIGLVSIYIYVRSCHQIFFCE